MTRNLLSTLLLALTVPVAADEPPATPPEPAALERLLELDGDARRCLPQIGVRRTAIADDRTILFVRHRDVWLNVLNRACPGLARSGSFAYESTGRIARLCRNDLILPLGHGTVRCPLGDFHEISPTQARAMLAPIERWALDNGVKSEAVELGLATE